MSASVSRFTSESLRNPLEELRPQMEESGVDLELWLPEGLISDNEGERARDQVLKLVIYFYKELREDSVEEPYISVSAGESGVCAMVVTVRDNGQMRTEAATRAFLEGMNYGDWEWFADDECTGVRLRFGVQGFREAGEGRIVKNDDEGLAR